MTFECDCSFCAEMQGDNSILENIIDDEFSNRILLRTDKFVVLPSLGHFIDGYLLVLSIEHFTSMGHIPGNYFKKLENVIKNTCDILEEKYTHPIIFEHGAASKTLLGGCCIDHAHTHIVPCPYDILNKINSNLRGQQIEHLIELKKYVQREMPYLFFESQLGKRMVFDATSLQSQYVRRLLAKSNDNEDIWDWLAFPEYKRLKTTYLNLIDEFEKVDL